MTKAYPTHPGYRPDIDGLRAIAVLAVVIFHAFPFRLPGGFIGVDIFFVISGFLISFIILDNLAKNSFSFAIFYSRRIRRIFPALILVMITFYAVGWFVLLPDEYSQFGKHILGGAGFVSNFVLWKESGYFDNAAQTKPLLHLWSLGIEEQFYLIWPCLLWFGWQRQWKLPALTLALAVASFIFNLVEVYHAPTAAFYSPLTRFWELMIGAMLAHITLRRYEALSRIAITDNDMLRNARSLLGAGLIGIGLLVITETRHFPGWLALLPVLGTALIISAGAKAWFNRAILSNRVLVWIGLISFPLYLWHWPLLSFARIVDGDTPVAWIRATALLTAIILAWLTYRLIEKPIRSSNPSRPLIMMLLSLMLLNGLAGFICYQTDGYLFRFPKNIRPLLHYSYDTHPAHGICFLDLGHDTADFKSCETAIVPSRKTIFIWGDSYAAHLYAGYQARFGNTFNIVQRTSSMCPPIMDIDGGTPSICKKNNDYILDLIQKSMPDHIILAAAWFMYDWKSIERTVMRLKSIGVNNIDLIGPVPVWQTDLSKELYLYWKANTPHIVPERMSFGLRKPASLDIDPQMDELAHRLGINYISPISILCNDEGCLTRLGDSADSLTASDNGHLTVKGSEFLVTHFPDIN